MLNGDGTVTYTPDADYAGPASFTYTVADAADAARPTPQWFAERGRHNDAPTAVDDTAPSMWPRTVTTLTAAELVGNDTDPDLANSPPTCCT